MINLKERRKYRERFYKRRKCCIVAGDGIMEKLYKVRNVPITPVEKSLIQFGNSLPVRLKNIYFKLLDLN